MSNLVRKVRRLRTDDPAAWPLSLGGRHSHRTPLAVGCLSLRRSHGSVFITCHARARGCFTWSGRWFVVTLLTKVRTLEHCSGRVSSCPARCSSLPTSCHVTRCHAPLIVTHVSPSPATTLPISSEDVSECHRLSVQEGRRGPPRETSSLRCKVTGPR